MVQPYCRRQEALRSRGAGPRVDSALTAACWAAKTTLIHSRLLQSKDIVILTDAPYEALAPDDALFEDTLGVGSLLAANAQHILQQLEAMVTKTGPNDSLFIHFSGHCTMVRVLPSPTLPGSQTSTRAQEAQRSAGVSILIDIAVVKLLHARPLNLRYGG